MPRRRWRSRRSAAAWRPSRIVCSRRMSLGGRPLASSSSQSCRRAALRIERIAAPRFYHASTSSLVQREMSSRPRKLHRRGGTRQRSLREGPCAMVDRYDPVRSRLGALSEHGQDLQNPGPPLRERWARPLCHNEAAWQGQARRRPPTRRGRVRPGCGTTRPTRRSTEY